MNTVYDDTSLDQAAHPCRKEGCGGRTPLSNGLCRPCWEALLVELEQAAAAQPDDEIVVEEYEATDRLGRTRKRRHIATERELEATAYLRDYAGSFGFLLDLKARLGAPRKATAGAPRGQTRLRWTDGLIDAVLRCKAADERRAAEQAAAPDREGEAEALEFIGSYTGTFDLIRDLKARGATRLSPRQIEVVLASKARDQQRAALAPKPGAKLDGWYRLADGTIVKVQKAVHGSGNLYAKRLVVEAGSGSWQYVPGLISTLTPEQRLTPEQAAEFGRLYGVCAVCGRTLTDEDSIAAGIGPICGRRLG